MFFFWNQNRLRPYKLGTKPPRDVVGVVYSKSGVNVVVDSSAKVQSAMRKASQTVGIDDLVAVKRSGQPKKSRRRFHMPRGSMAINK